MPTKPGTISMPLESRHERLPKKTGANRLKPIKTTPLANPKASLSSNKRLSGFLKQFGVTDGKAIRAKSAASLGQMVERVNAHLAASQTHKGIRFSVNREAGKTMVTIRDSRTGEVIRNFPSESMMQVAANLRTGSGMLFSSEG